MPAPSDTVVASSPEISPLCQQLLEESEAMASYALASGLRMPPALLQQLETTRRAPEAELEKLAQAHAQLAELVTPATPRFIVGLSESQSLNRMTRFLGHFSLVRRMTMTAILSLVAFLGCSLSPYINHPEYGNLFQSAGIPLLVNELFILAAAALGASFAGLSQAEREISAKTFDPQGQVTYWTRFIHGLIAGLILATLINFNFTPTEEPTDGKHVVVRFSAAALALLGGFSSSVVYRMLNRLVEALETMVRGGADEAMQATQQASKARLNQQLVQERLRMATTLAGLQQQLMSGKDAAAVLEQFDVLVQGLLSEGTLPMQLPAAAKPQTPPPPSEPSETPAASSESSGG